MTAIRKGVDHCWQDWACTEDRFKFQRSKGSSNLCSQKKKKKNTLIHSKSLRHKTDRSKSAHILSGLAKNTADKRKLPDVMQHRTFFSFIVTVFFLFQFLEVAER